MELGARPNFYFGVPKIAIPLRYTFLNQNHIRNPRFKLVRPGGGVMHSRGSVIRGSCTKVRNFFDRPRIMSAAGSGGNDMPRAQTQTIGEGGRSPAGTNKHHLFKRIRDLGVE